MMERRPETISFYRKRLPHWSVRDALYFVTIRQKNSIPADAAMKIRAKILDLENYSEDERLMLRRKILFEMEKWLDRPSEEGVLTNGDAPSIIKEAIKFRIDNGTWRMAEYVIMPNHLHLLAKSGNQSLSQSMRRLLIGYVINFNRRHKRYGHLFQNRYKSIICEEDPYLLELARYIHLNPVRAGMVKGLRELRDYPWTGHGVIIGRQKREWQ
ncbi:MAG: transposase, partial [Lentisphaerae bacterium]|nr:transposase [Lentisphaerota bacterium]